MVLLNRVFVLSVVVLQNHEDEKIRTADLRCLGAPFDTSIWVFWEYTRMGGGLNRGRCMAGWRGRAGSIAHSSDFIV